MKLKRFISAVLSAALLTSSLSLNVCYAGETADLAAAGEDETVSGAGAELAPCASSSDTPYPVEGGNIYYNSSGEITDCDESVTSAVIPSVIGGVEITSIGSDAFSYCFDLTSVTIPDSVTSIGKNAFHTCTGLTSVTIPGSVTSIGEYAFGNCQGLTSVTILDGVTSIGNYAFQLCTGLTSVTIPGSVTSIGQCAFSDCTALTSVTISDGVTSIGSAAFNGCTGLTSVTIPGSVTSIGGGAFGGCSALTSVTIPGSVTSIGDTAFSGCTGLTNVTIPDSVTSIGVAAFGNCTGLTSINVSENNSNYSSIDGVLYNKEKTTLLACPGGVTGSFDIPDGVTSIVRLAFGYCSALTNITIPDSVTSIDGEAFQGCTGLTNVTIPDSVTSIDGAFRDCTGLTSVTIPGSVTSIGGSTFSGCTGLTSITIPGSVTSIGDFAFSGCSALTDVTIPDSVTSIDDYAFQGCTSLTSVTIPGSVTSIDIGIFEGCTGLTSINVSENNSNYSSIDGVLYNKEKTTLLAYPGGATGSFDIPDSVTSIGSLAFSGCSVLTGVTIPDSITRIAKFTFEDCTGLKSVTIPGSETSLDFSVFIGCTDLTTIYCYKNSKADNSSLYPSGVTIVYLDDATTETSTVTATETTTETTTVTTTVTTTETSTETSTEATTKYATMNVQAFSPNATITGEGRVIDYSKYRDGEVTVHLNITNVEQTSGIYAYTFLLDYNPDVVEMTGAYMPKSDENYAFCGDRLPYSESLTNTAIAAIPTSDNEKYADILPAGGENTLTAAQLGRVILENTAAAEDGAGINKSGELYSFVFKVKGEGDADIHAVLQHDGISGISVFEKDDVVVTAQAVSANIIVKDIDDSLNNIGNVNYDNTISASDAAALLQKVLNTGFKMECEKAYPDNYLEICDVNGDTTITATDAACILQKTLDGSFKFAVE